MVAAAVHKVLGVLELLRPLLDNGDGINEAVAELKRSGMKKLMLCFADEDQRTKCIDVLTPTVMKTIMEHLPPELEELNLAYSKRGAEKIRVVSEGLEALQHLQVLKCVGHAVERAKQFARGCLAHSACLNVSLVQLACVSSNLACRQQPLEVFIC